MDIVDIAIAKKLAGGGGSGSSLPSVTSADEGKVLAVNASGEWAAEQKIVLISESEEGVLNKTWNEIFTLLSSGTICLIHQALSDGAFLSYVSAAYEGENAALLVSATGLTSQFPVLEFIAETVNSYPYID